MDRPNMRGDVINEITRNSLIDTYGNGHFRLSKFWDFIEVKQVGDDDDMVHIRFVGKLRKSIPSEIQGLVLSQLYFCMVHSHQSKGFYEFENVPLYRELKKEHTFTKRSDLPFKEITLSLGEYECIKVKGRRNPYEGIV